MKGQERGTLERLSGPGGQRNDAVAKNTALMRLTIVCSIASLLLCLRSPVLAQDAITRKDAGFTLSVGYAQGRDYAQAIKMFWLAKGYDVVKTGFFVNLETGVEFRVLDEFFLNPRLRWGVTWLERKALFGYLPAAGSLEMNSVVLPGMAGKYFVSFGHHFFYADAFVSGILAFSGQVDLTLSSEKVELGYGVGYQYVNGGNGFGIEIGSSSIPVKVPGVYEANFGGFELTLTYFFSTADDANEPPPGGR